MRVRGIVDDLPALTSVAVLGFGFIALGLGYSWFWVVWVVGFVSLVPITAILTDRLADRTQEAPTESDEAEALDVLRERYAAGELDEAEFEHRLDALLGTETVEEAQERVDDGSRGDRHRTEAEGERP